MDSSIPPASRLGLCGRQPQRGHRHHRCDPQRRSTGCRM